MPKHISYQLQWSVPTQEYVVTYEGKPHTPRLAPDSSSWFDWLETISSFSFQKRGGEVCTVRKESVQRGGSYWYAYRRSGQRMLKRYLARSSELTLVRLEMVTETLYEVEGNVEKILSSQPLLTTKLSIPRLPVQHVSRPRLLAQLQQGMQGQITLVSAPAGSGKTTLLVEWATTAKYPVAWISLEAADNDPRRFLSYLIAALASLDGLIETATRAYHFTETRDTESVLSSLLNDLARLLQQDVIVILDDYHLLDTETIETLLNFLLNHLPPQLHLVIGTRVDPPLALARLRMQMQLSEVHTAELRFLSSEVETLMQAMGISLSTEAMGLLERHTEGWIAGIQLLALALRGHADATAFLQTFNGTHRFLLDYVSEEILAQQTSETQRFLLMTSVLESMTGPLCEAVTELSSGQLRLTALLKANLFVSATDDTDTWYRYHPLFANALRTHLQKIEPDVIPHIYARASHWYEQQQRREEACNYAFLAGDLSRAAQLVARYLPYMVEQGYFEQIRHWLGQLPPNLIAASPQLYITMPWLHSLDKHNPDSVELALQRMEQHIQEQRQQTTAWEEPQSVLNLFRAVTALTQNNHLRAFTLINEALRLLNTHKTGLSQKLTQFLRIILSLTYGARGDLETATRLLLDLNLTQAAEPLSVIHMTTTFLLGEIYRAQGQLHITEALYENPSLEFTTPPALPPIPLTLTSFILLRQASLFYEWNQLSKAEHIIQQVLEIMPRTDKPPFFAFGLWAQARIHLAQGQPADAKYFLELVRQQPELAGEIAAGEERPPVDIPTLAARLALACDQLAEAECWEKTCGIHYDYVPLTLLESRQMFAYFTLARILIARGRVGRMKTALTQALILLSHWRDCAQQSGFQGWSIEIQMLTALALQAQGKTQQALTTLGSALAQAEPEGYLRLFVDEGQPMLHLLTQVSAYTTASSSYLQQIQAALSDTEQRQLEPAQVATSQALVDQLSARELEVLSLMATGASNQQIADQLIISLNTAKRHVKHILGKLAVSNRTQAILRAREIQLL